LNVIVKHIITQIRILTAGVAFGRHRSVFVLEVFKAAVQSI